MTHQPIPHPPIPIVGGGIAGLTTALALAHHGVSSHIYERATVLEEIGAGLQLSPNAMKVLDTIGLLEPLLLKAVSPEAIHLHDGRTAKRLAVLPLGRSALERYKAPYCVIHRGDLQQVLASACDANPLITLTLGAKIEPTQEHPLIIAADGVHSVWRGKIRNQARATFAGMVAWRITHDVDNPEPVTKVWFGPKAHLVDYPISSGQQRNLVAIAQADSLPDGKVDAARALRQSFAQWHPSVLDRLERQAGWLPWALNSVDPKAAWTGQWETTAIALVGDAAHAMLPFAAQGAASAIEDAWVLAEQLASQSSVSHALRSYETWRKPRVTQIWQEAVKNGKIYHLTGPMAFGRNMVLQSSSGQSLVARYDWIYGWSPTSGEAKSSIAP